jgi:Flp pilus assembly protein TadG
MHTPAKSKGHRVKVNFFIRNLDKASRSKGQALVEFTLIITLFLAIAWIPADFGLAFLSGQIAQNASREGARLAAATAPWNAAEVETQVRNRLASALLHDLVVEVDRSCEASLGVPVVRVTVTGDYDFLFYQLLRLLGLPAPDSVSINRETIMRYEHFEGC